MMLRKVALTFLMVLLAPVVALSAQSVEDDTIPPPSELAELREQVKALIVEEGVPSVAVGVALEGEIIWQEAFGWADRERRIRATPHTMYSTASISKPITAAGLMVLVENGDVDLDRPINEYLRGTALTGRAGNPDDATVRRVLDHTSGLPLHYQFFYEDEPYARPSMEESIRRYGVVVFEPGERYQYSNIGYGVLDHVIRSVSGKSYTDFMREEVFVPLGMHRTAVGIPSRHEDHHAIRYGPDQQPIPYYDFDHRGASAVFSSAHDLLRFGMFNIGTLKPDQRAILSKETLAAMHERSAVTGAQSGYGLGWITQEHESGLMEVWHSGGMGGVRTMLLMVPEEKLVVTVLVNTQNNAPLAMAGRIAHTLLPDRFDDPDADDESPPEESEFDPSRIAGTWNGSVTTYEANDDLAMEVTENGEIILQLGDQPRVLLDNARFDDDGFLQGVFQGDIGTEDANRRPYYLYLNMRPHGDRMYGSITAVSRGGSRIGNALSSFAELERQ